MDDPVFILASTDPEVTAALIAGSVAVLLAGVTGLAAYITRKRERQRELYGKAYEVAMAWREMLYRVRRRADGDEADRRLVDRFHTLQEEIDYYQGWIASESPFLARSYCRLVNGLKEAVSGPIVEAWKEGERRPPWAGTKEGDVHPDCSETSDRFLFDVRWHLSIFVLPRIVVAWRNRKWFGGQK